jgi:hypothetical protein
MSLLMVVLAAMILFVEMARNHQPAEAALLLGLLAAAALAARWLLRDLRAHPANFPTSTPAHGLGFVATGADGRRPRSRWASENRVEP